MKRGEEEHHAFMKSNFRESRPVANGRSNSIEKAVQTDIKNVNSKLVSFFFTKKKIQKKHKIIFLYKKYLLGSL